MFWQRHHPILRRLILTANATLPPVCVWFWFRGAWPAFAAALVGTAIFHTALAIGIFHPRCPWLGPVFRRFRTAQKAVWLTIDDGPDGESTVRLAEALQSRGVRATFFVVGERAREHPEAVRAVMAKGHTLANHSDTHPRCTMWCLNRRRVRAEVSGCAEVLHGAGEDHPWFRPPVGHKAPALHPVLRSLGVRLVSWTTGGRDGYGPDPAPLIRRILAQGTPGSILLLHEGRPHAHATVLAVVDAVLAQGYQFVIPTDSELVE